MQPNDMILCTKKIDDDEHDDDEKNTVFVHDNIVWWMNMKKNVYEMSDIGHKNVCLNRKTKKYNKSIEKKHSIILLEKEKNDEKLSAKIANSPTVKVPLYLTYGYASLIACRPAPWIK